MYRNPAVRPARLGAAAVIVLWPAVLAAAPVAVLFDSDRWDVRGGGPVAHLGRDAFAGTALLRGVELEDGVIEFDVAVDGRRSYPGLIFRLQSDREFERFYLRPHRAGLYPDALQYTPVFGGIAGWQLYHGEGFTAGVVLPKDEWVRVRLEVAGSQARVYVGESDEAALTIPWLQHGTSKGAIGVMGPTDGTSYFSNFRYDLRNDLTFADPPARSMPEGMIDAWEVSQAFPAGQIDRNTYPSFFQVFQAGWRTVQADDTGLVDVARYTPEPPAAPRCVMARRIVYSKRPRTVKLSLGYSDDVTVFLNSQPVFSGISGYRSRDPSFVGAVGLFETLHLPLNKGLNEIMLMVTDAFGGWGFMGRLDPPLDPPPQRSDVLTKVWETPADFKIPESVLFDAKRDILYVSNFNKVGPGQPNRGFLSRVTKDGRIEKLRWVAGLDGPCGMAMRDDHLYVAESSGNLVKIDVDAGKVVERYPMPGPTFLNDVTVDRAGTIYITNTSGAAGALDLYAFHDGKGSAFKKGYDLHRTNGLFFHEGELITGSSGDGLLKAVSVENGNVRTITSLGAGVIDGIRADRAGNYLVSHWEGQVYRISPSGEVEQILDTMGEGRNTADFEFIADEDLLVIPTFLGNTVAAYRYQAG